MISQLRQETQGSVLLVDCGNGIFHTGKDTATSDPSKGELPIEAMNAMKYDAMALGDRDMVHDASIVSARFREAEFPILTANVGPADVLPNLRTHLLLEIDGHTVAVVGVTARKAVERSEILGVTLEVEDPAEAVKRLVGEVHDRADVIIILSNLDQKTNESLAQEVSGIDAIVGVYGGRQTKPLVFQGSEGQVVLHSSGVQGRSLGILVLEFDAQGRVVTFSGQVKDLTPENANDQEMVQIMRNYGVRP